MTDYEVRDVAADVHFAGDALVVRLSDGREISVSYPCSSAFIRVPFHQLFALYTTAAM